MIEQFRDWAFGRRGHDHSHRVYDWWSRHDLAYAAFVGTFLLGRTAEFRARTVKALSLEPGDTVLDVGCGLGSNFHHLARAVGPTGTIVGIDASRGMVARAAQRAATLDCETAVVRADATRLPLHDGHFDAACATLSLSSMTDPETVVANLRRLLRPDGHLAILDTRSFQNTPLRWLNPIVEGVSALLTNWHPDARIIQSVEETFPAVSIETFHRGTVYVVTGRLTE